MDWGDLWGRGGEVLPGVGREICGGEDGFRWVR